jgi:hypothetical protein
MWMRRPLASQYLSFVHGISATPATLAKYGSLKTGPSFETRGRFPVYSPAALDAWALARSNTKATV